jgi:hypothetical protein
MEKEFIPYEQALALKELGFNEHCLAFYGGDGDSKVYYNSLRNGSGDYVPYKASERHKWFGAPLYQQAFRWFREKYKLYSHVRESYSFDNTLEFVTQINGSYVNHGIFDKPVNRFETHEEAELACLIKLIEIVKNK